jgi:equilibrative nucleoside transporter 1/2/3
MQCFVAVHAVTFLGIAAFTQLCGLTLYSVVFPRVPAVKAYRLKAMQQGSLTVSDDLAVAGVKKESKVLILPTSMKEIH